MKNITLTDKLSTDGNTDTSSGAAVFQTFYTNNASVEFDNVKVEVEGEVQSFSNNNKVDGGYFAVYFGSTKEVIIKDSTFTYNGNIANSSMKYHAIEVSGNASNIITDNFTMKNSTITAFNRAINCDGVTGITLNDVKMTLGYVAGKESKGINVTVTTSANASSNHAAARQTNVIITTTDCTVECNDASAPSSGSIYGIYLNDESSTMNLTINTNLDVAVKGQHTIAGNSSVASLYFVGDGKDTRGGSALASLTVNQNATLTVNNTVSNASGYTLKVGTSDNGTTYNGTDKTFSNTTIYLETSSA